MDFEIVSKFMLSENQRDVINSISDGLNNSLNYQTIEGVTGSGKTFVMAKIIEKMNRQTLIVSHNKTLSAQLYREFKEFFPNNHVEYFVSYYDYYQPEAYIPARDIYIEKTTQINDDLEKLRSSAVVSLLEHRDTIVVASVSCIYGLGNPQDYKDMAIEIKIGMSLNLNKFALDMIYLQYRRTDLSILNTNEFKINGDILEIKLSYSIYNIKIVLDYGQIEKITLISSDDIQPVEKIKIYPAKLFATPKDELARAIESVKLELDFEYKKLLDDNKVAIADRLKTKTEYDMDMLRETGFCSGVENYSRHILNKPPGSSPYTVIDVFEKDFLMFIDESHVSVPQIGGMYNGDKSRKQTLIDFGFRLPSALDNRPLKYQEFENKINQCVFVSATPGDYELSLSQNISKLIIRPTGLLDPIIETFSNDGLMERVYENIVNNVKNNERVIILTVTKKMSEYLANYLSDLSIKTKYLHSEIDTMERVEIIKDLRLGKFDVLVGVNLLREGIDIPEVSLVIILDADKVGFLRSKKSLIQIIGRAARHQNGRVMMFCDKVSLQMQQAIEETSQRREIQQKYNIENNITPVSVKKDIKDIILKKQDKELQDLDMISKITKNFNLSSKSGVKNCIKELTKLMNSYVNDEDFENAIKVRDFIKELNDK